jgi:hypothetical protein
MSERQRIGRIRSPRGIKMGRPEMGERYPRTIRFPIEMNDEIEISATDAGYTSINQYVLDIICAAKEAGLFPATVPDRDSGQQALPIPA